MNKINKNKIIWKKKSVEIDITKSIEDIEKMFEKNINVFTENNEKISKTGKILLKLYIDQNNTTIDSLKTEQLERMFDKKYEQTLLNLYDIIMDTESPSIKDLIISNNKEFIHKSHGYITTEIYKNSQSGGSLRKYQQEREDEKIIYLPYTGTGNIPDIDNIDDRMIENRERFTTNSIINPLNSWYMNDPNNDRYPNERNEEISQYVNYYSKLSRVDDDKFKKYNIDIDDIKITDELYKRWYMWLHNHLEKEEQHNDLFDFENIKYLKLFKKIKVFWQTLYSDLNNVFPVIDYYIYSITENNDIDWCVLLNLFNYIIEIILLLLMFDNFLKDIKLINIYNFTSIKEKIIVTFESLGDSHASMIFTKHSNDFVNFFSELSNNKDVIKFAKELYNYLDNNLKILNKYFSEKIITDFNSFKKTNNLLLKKMDEIKNIFDDSYISEKKNIDNIINNIFKNNKTFRSIIFDSDEKKDDIDIVYNKLKEHRDEIQKMKQTFKNIIKKTNNSKKGSFNLIMKENQYKNCNSININPFLKNNVFINRIFKNNFFRKQVDGDDLEKRIEITLETLKYIEKEEISIGNENNKAIINTEKSLDIHLDIIKHRIVNDIVNNIYLSDEGYKWNSIWLESIDNNDTVNIKINNIMNEINEVKGIGEEKNERITTYLIAKIVDDIIISKIISIINKSVSTYLKNKFKENELKDEEEIEEKVEGKEEEEEEEEETAMVNEDKAKAEEEDDLFLIDSGFKLRFDKLLKNMIKYYNEPGNKNKNYSDLALLSSSILLEGAEITGFENEEGYFKKYVIKEDLNSGNSVYCKIVNISLLKLLKEKGINGNIKDKKKQNILFYIINSNNYKLLKQVLDTIDFNIPVQTLDSKNYKNITPLHYLVKRYIGYINKYKKHPQRNSFCNNYYYLYRERNEEYRKQMLSDPKYKNNLPTYYKIILPMVLTMYCLNLNFENNKFDRKNIKITNIIKKDKIYKHKNKVISDVIGKFKKLKGYYELTNNIDDIETQNIDNNDSIFETDEKDISKLFNKLFESFNSDNNSYINDIFSYNEMWNKLLDTDIKENENDILNKQELLNKLIQLKIEIKDNKYYPDYEELTSFFNNIKEKNNLKKKYIYMIGKINKEEINKKTLKDEKERVINIFSHVVKTVILGSLYLVLLKTCTKFITNASKINSEIMITLKNLSNTIYNYLIKKNDISYILVTNILEKTKMGKDDNYNFGIDTVFYELSKKIQTTLNINEDSILLSKIKDNIYPLYEETLIFYVHDMQNLVKKLNTTLIHNYSYSEMMCIILKKAKSEKKIEKSIRNNKEDKKWWLEESQTINRTENVTI